MVRPPRFHTKPLRKHPRSGWVQAVTLIIIIAASLLIMRWQATSDEWASTDMRFTLCGQGGSQGCVIDGDTIAIAQNGKIRKIRITGYNAPELKGECVAEIGLAKRSRKALQNWLNQGPFTMSGSDDPPYDQYGRELREIKRGDQWLSDSMIEQGMAQESGWDFQRGGWCD